VTIAQCKAFRRDCETGEMSKRFKPAKGNRKSKSTRRALALQRKIRLAGGGTRSVGYGSK